MKKIVVMLLVVMMCISLVACSGAKAEDAAVRIALLMKTLSKSKPRLKKKISQLDSALSILKHLSGLQVITRLSLLLKHKVSKLSNTMLLKTPSNNSKCVMMRLQKALMA